MTKRLGEITDSLRVKIDALHGARERALADGRQVIQLSSKAIKHLHRQEFGAADELLAELRKMVDTAIQHVSPYPSIKHAPYFQDAVKEYVEASVLAALIRGDEIPAPDELGVEPAAYLNGICEAASELRRYALDELRRGRHDNAKNLSNMMEDIYDELITFDYPDALTSNLRRNVDALRAVLERTQSDLAVTGTQLELIEELRKTRGEK